MTDREYFKYRKDYWRHKTLWCGGSNEKPAQQENFDRVEKVFGKLK